MTFKCQQSYPSYLCICPSSTSPYPDTPPCTGSFRIVTAFILFTSGLCSHLKFYLFFFCFQVLSSTTFLPQILSPLVGLLSQRLPDYTLKQCQSTSPFSPFPLLKISHSFPLRSLLPRAKFLTQGFKASPLALTYMFCHTLTTYLSSQMFHCSTLVAFCTHHTELGSFYFTHAMFSPWNADSPHQQNR